MIQANYFSIVIDESLQSNIIDLVDSPSAPNILNDDSEVIDYHSFGKIQEDILTSDCLTKDDVEKPPEHLWEVDDEPVVSCKDRKLKRLKKKSDANTISQTSAKSDRLSKRNRNYKNEEDLFSSDVSFVAPVNKKRNIGAESTVRSLSKDDADDDDEEEDIWNIQSNTKPILRQESSDPDFPAEMNFPTASPNAWDVLLKNANCDKKIGRSGHNTSSLRTAALTGYKRVNRLHQKILVFAHHKVCDLNIIDFAQPSINLI